MTVAQLIRDLRDSVNDLAKNHVPCSPLASRIENELAHILESLQPAAPKEEPCKRCGAWEDCPDCTTDKTMGDGQ